MASTLTVIMQTSITKSRQVHITAANGTELVAAAADTPGSIFAKRPLKHLILHLLEKCIFGSLFLPSIIMLHLLPSQTVGKYHIN